MSRDAATAAAAALRHGAYNVYRPVVESRGDILKKT